MANEEKRIIEAISVTQTRDKKGRLTKGARNPWMKPFFLLALETAMRRSDLLRLEWKNINLEKRTAHLQTSKNGFGRTIPLSTKAVAILQELPKDPAGKVFPLTANAVKKFWQRAMQQLNIDDLHFHDTRHEATSRFCEKGLQLLEVASITGHRDPRMLMRYTHLFAENLAEKLG
jgi:integrase